MPSGGTSVATATALNMEASGGEVKHAREANGKAPAGKTRGTGTSVVNVITTEDRR